MNIISRKNPYTVKMFIQDFTKSTSQSSQKVLHAAKQQLPELKCKKNDLMTLKPRVINNFIIDQNEKSQGAKENI